MGVGGGVIAGSGVRPTMPRKTRRASCRQLARPWPAPARVYRHALGRGMPPSPPGRGACRGWPTKGRTRRAGTAAPPTCDAGPRQATSHRPAPALTPALTLTPPLTPPHTPPPPPPPAPTYNTPPLSSASVGATSTRSTLYSILWTTPVVVREPRRASLRPGRGLVRTPSRPDTAPLPRGPHSIRRKPGRSP